MQVKNPIIEEIDDNKTSLMSFSKELDLKRNDKKSELIKNYPVVYIHYWKSNNKYHVYVGETKNFFRRTEEHYDKMKEYSSWQYQLNTNKASLFVITHENFNKSFTMDIENKLIHYLSGSSNVKKVHNSNGNPQSKYFPCEQFDAMFAKIWNQLRNRNKDLFLLESKIKDSAIFKSSPLHKLNAEQSLAKEQIIHCINDSLLQNVNHRLIFVLGSAGTGKSVLMNSVFYEILNSRKFTIDESNIIRKNISCAILVNHYDQLKLYQQIINKLDLAIENEQLVFNPTEFINLFKNKKQDKLFDVVFVDEGHLLLTQNNQAFSDHNHLKEIIKYSKIVVVMFDKKQIMNAEQYLDSKSIENYIKIAKKNDCFIELKNQMRIHANSNVLGWLEKILDYHIIEKLPADCGEYDIKVFRTPFDLEKAIKKKANNKKTSLSRIIATYDWPYSGKSRSKVDKYWNVTIGSWSKPWNREILRFSSRKEKRGVQDLPWAEQPQTIDEVGSIYSIQGFDLNYVGVILGPSVKYRDGKIVFDVKKSCNKKAVQKRTLEDGSKVSFGEDFLNNELGVLMTRGVNGLYLYACDEELQKQLIKCISKK